MEFLFTVGCGFVIIFTIYNVICYKTRKIIYTISYKYSVLNDKYYSTQLIFGLVNSILLFLSYLVWIKVSKSPALFIMQTMVIFWGLNYALEFYSKKKWYLSTKKPL